MKSIGRLSPFLVTLCFLDIFRLVTTACDVNCLCRQTDNESRMICQRSGSTRVPITFPEDVVRLEIEDMFLVDDTFSNTTLPELRHLDHLSIRRSRFKKIQRLAFGHMEKLTDLRLSDNSIEDIASGSFERMNNIREIHLDGNHLSHLSRELFAHLKLDVLDLSRNNFIRIPEASLTGSSIRSFRLDSNYLDVVEKTNFGPLRTNLEQLSISHNKRPLQLDNESINQLQALRRVDLRSSQISDTSFLVNAKAVNVDISGNPLNSTKFWKTLDLAKAESFAARNLNLSNLPVGSLNSLCNASLLDFSENRISLLYPEAFRATPKLRSLNLAGNALTFLLLSFSRYLLGLEVLNLSANALQFLPDESFGELRHLKLLDLSRNRVQFVSEVTFRSSSVSTFVEGNPLHCNCQLLWLHTWLRSNQEDAARSAITCASPFSMQLAHVDAGNLTCLPPAILPLPTVVEVLEGSDHLLVCWSVSDPPSSMRWINSSVSVAPSFMQNRTDLKMQTILRIPKVSQRHSGLYICIAENILGSATATLTLEVVARVRSRSSSSPPASAALSISTTDSVSTATPMSGQNKSSLKTLLSSPSSESAASLLKEPNSTVHIYTSITTRLSFTSLTDSIVTSNQRTHRWNAIATAQLNKTDTWFTVRVKGFNRNHEHLETTARLFVDSDERLRLSSSTISSTDLETLHRTSSEKSLVDAQATVFESSVDAAADASGSSNATSKFRNDVTNPSVHNAIERNGCLEAGCSKNGGTLGRTDKNDDHTNNDNRSSISMGSNRANIIFTGGEEINHANGDKSETVKLLSNFELGLREMNSWGILLLTFLAIFIARVA